jgi:hypothetical protein
LPWSSTSDSKAKAKDVTEEGNGRFRVVGAGPDPGELDDPHALLAIPPQAPGQPPGLSTSWS